MVPFKGAAQALIIIACATKNKTMILPQLFPIMLGCHRDKKRFYQGFLTKNQPFTQRFSL
jgi:hypothetical protein